MQILGVLERVTFFDADRQFLIALLNVDGEERPVKIVGNAGESFVPGLRYALQGKWETHKRFGLQFKFEDWMQEEPLSKNEVVAYLQKYGSGIGVKTAERIWDKFGAEAIGKLIASPSEVAEAVPRLSASQADLISAELKANAKTQHARAKLLVMLHGIRGAASIAEECIAEWGEFAADHLRRNPYETLDMKIRNYGFSAADQIYLESGGDPLSEKRAVRLIVYLIESDRSGSTWFQQSDLRELYTARSGPEPLYFDHAFGLCIEQNLIWVSGGLVSIKRHADCEHYIAQHIERILCGQHVEEESIESPPSWKESAAYDFSKARRFK